MKMTLHEVRAIEKFFKELHTLVENNTGLSTEINIRLQQHEGPPSATTVIAGHFLGFIQMNIQNQGPLLHTIQVAKLECGVVLDPGTVKRSVQSLFQDIKKDLPGE